MIHLSSPNFIITFLYSVVKVPRQSFTYFDAIFLPLSFQDLAHAMIQVQECCCNVVVSIMHTDIRLCFALTRVRKGRRCMSVQEKAWCEIVTRCKTQATFYVKWHNTLNWYLKKPASSIVSNVLRSLYLERMRRRPNLRW